MRITIIENDFAKTQWQPMYINNVRHNVTSLSGMFYADCAEHPFVRCSQHRLSALASAYLQSGGSVRTSGNTYSLKEQP